MQALFPHDHLSTRLVRQKTTPSHSLPHHHHHKQKHQYPLQASNRCTRHNQAASAAVLITSAGVNLH